MTILPFTLSATQSAIVCTGSLGLRHIDEILTAIARMNSGQISIDLSEVRCSPSQLFPLAIFLTHERGRGKRFRVIIPRRAWEHNRFNDTGLSALLDPEYFHKPVSTDNHLAVRTFDNHEGMYGATQEVLENVLKNVTFVDRQAFSAFEWVLYELADNTLEHGHSSTGTLLLVDYIFRQSIVQITVCDGGATIPGTLEDQFPTLDDVSLIVKSIERGVGRRDSSGHLVGGGNGLFGAFRLAECSQGALLIRSRKGLVRLAMKRASDGSKSLTTTKWISQSAAMPGTFLQFSLKFTEPELVRRALAFDQAAKTHIWDFIDQMEDEHSEGILLRVSERKHEVKSRAGGRIFATYLRNMLNLSDHPMILDFSGVSTISSSFADEVFGRLGAHLNRRLRVKNAEESVSLIINNFQSGRLPVE